MKDTYEFDLLLTFYLDWRTLQEYMSKPHEALVSSLCIEERWCAIGLALYYLGADFFLGGVCPSLKFDSVEDFVCLGVVFS